MVADGESECSYNKDAEILNVIQMIRNHDPR